MSDTPKVSDEAKKAAAYVFPTWSDEWWNTIASKTDNEACRNEYRSLWEEASSKRAYAAAVTQQAIDRETAALRRQLFAAKEDSERLRDALYEAQKWFISVGANCRRALPSEYLLNEAIPNNAQSGIALCEAARARATPFST
jgi:hypothetical protein